jgi:hypothetical protein
MWSPCSARFRSASHHRRWNNWSRSSRTTGLAMGPPRLGIAVWRRRLASKLPRSNPDELEHSVQFLVPFS